MAQDSLDEAMQRGTQVQMNMASEEDEVVEKDYMLDELELHRERRDEEKKRQALAELSSLGHEKKMAKDQLKVLHDTLSDSVLQEKKCQDHVEKQQMMVEFHRNRAAAVSMQIEKLNAELKQQERAGWDDILHRDEMRAKNSNLRKTGGFSDSMGRMDAGPLGAPAGDRAQPRQFGLGHSHSGSFRRAPKSKSRGGAAAAAAKLAVSRSRSAVGGDVTEQIMLEVARGRIVGNPQLPPSDGVQGASTNRSSSSSAKAATGFLGHQSNIISCYTGSKSKDSRHRSSSTPNIQTPDAKQATLLDYFEEKDKVDKPVRRLSGSLFNNVDDMLEEVDAFQDEDSSAQTFHLEEEARLEHERIQTIARYREEYMDEEAEKRKLAQERRTLNLYREEIRDELIMKAGSAREAFDGLDTNGSGCVCMNEFDGGIRGLGVNYQDITGYANIRDLFKLFDPDKKGFITFENMFPLAAKASTDTERMSTPEFWNYWCKQTKDITKDFTSSPTASSRNSKWDLGGPEEKLHMINSNRQKRADVEEKKKWMRGMIHRLKHRGKSDARCREIVALHLPRGSGPKDSEDVMTFSQVEVNNCRKKYSDKVQESVRNIEKSVHDMHESKRKLHHSKQQLWKVTEEPHIRHQMTEEIRTNLLMPGLFMKKDQHFDEN